MEKFGHILNQIVVHSQIDYPVLQISSLLGLFQQFFHSLLNLLIFLDQLGYLLSLVAINLS